jgi:hypothetical protein
MPNAGELFIDGILCGALASGYLGCGYESPPPIADAGPTSSSASASTEELNCRYEPFDGLCRVGRVSEHASPSGSVMFTVTSVADFKAGSHFDQDFRIASDSVEKFRDYIHKPTTLLLCKGEVIASGTCKVRTRGTARTLVLFEQEP